MPKDELANLSESLINIISLKVKIQDNLETVGGYVDIPIKERKQLIYLGNKEKVTVLFGQKETLF